MKRASWLGLLLLSGCAPPSSFSAVDVETGQSVQLSKTKLRAYQTFSGSYSSPQLGELQLEQHDEKLLGSYRDLVCGCAIHGTLLDGTVTDNVASFSMEVTRDGCGNDAPRTLSASGFLFLRTLAPRGGPTELYGTLAYREPSRAQGSRTIAIARDGAPTVVVARSQPPAPQQTLVDHCP